MLPLLAITWDVATIGAFSAATVAIITAIGAAVVKVIEAINKNTAAIQDSTVQSAAADLVKIEQGQRALAVRGAQPVTPTNLPTTPSAVVGSNVADATLRLLSTVSTTPAAPPVTQETLEALVKRFEDLLAEVKGLRP